MTKTITVDNGEIFALGGLFLLALIFSFILDSLHFPVAWFLVPLLVAIIFSIVRGKVESFPHSAGALGQGMIAVVTASNFSVDSLINAQSYLLPLLGAIFITGTFSLFNGFLLYKIAKIDPCSSFLGSIPGAGSSLVAMSEEMGADAIAVTVLQYVRILLVSLIVPNIVALYFSTPVLATPMVESCNPELCFSPPNDILITADLPQSLITAIIKTLLIIFTAIVAIQIGKIIKLPSNLFLAPFFSGLALFWLIPTTIPPLVFSIGLFLLGLSTGVKFDLKTIHKLLKAVLIEVILVIFLIIVCFIIGYEFHQITGLDMMSSLLGTTPGGLNTMTATALELGGDSGMVLTMQMVRMFFILTFSPFFAGTILQIDYSHHENN
ncbi:AbrB family transcriptional regulator [Cyanobacterium stanieri LEGE 03274]|uniref:AbrB family transcriptional regulator n=1 Tax=Cyanobacterium stanieri LEGE 03274 TaxID=1828756 RepID=A0ABR9V2T4_9CHRO|nr:AbrB family transcriptional regulator [Cyanobacterium stanieri]MBE9222142.1 AbrB family transcriptional regulator [Cyanobacterium stanieri LEGE 03274]